MISSNNCEEQNLVYNHRLSSVGPSGVTGQDVIHEPNGIDLAMKLHYIHGVYFFNKEASQGMSIMRIKESFFYWCNEHYVTCGRFRRSKAGRPYLKCNDCGIRMVEARCDKTIDEFLEISKKDSSSLNFSCLVYNLPIGPELYFSPLLYIQLTQFKCGGLSFGLSWAHILGDIFLATEWFSSWGKYLGGLKTYGPLKIPKPGMDPVKSEKTLPPLSLKRVDPVGDHWVTANNHKMGSFVFHLTPSLVSNFLSKVWGQSKIDQCPVFESICAIMWQCIAKVRDGDSKVVTLCKKDHDRSDMSSNNTQIVSSVRANFPIKDSDLKKLAMLLVDEAVDERRLIEQTVEQDNGLLDYIVYGANLTFINFEEANFYGLQWNGMEPDFVYHSIHGVGDEGAVSVLPWPNASEGDNNCGRIVTVTLPMNAMLKLKFELHKNGLLLECSLDS